MLGYRVHSRITSRQDGVGEVLVTYQDATLQLPLDIKGGPKISFRDPDVSWEEKCRLQHIAGFIPRKDIIKFAIFLHFGGMYYTYDQKTGLLHINRLSSRVTGTLTLVLMLLLVWYQWSQY